MFFHSLTAPLLVSTHRNSSSLQSGSGKQKLLPLLTLLIIAAGIFLRLYHFIDNRSLWRDELYLAVSLIKMDFWELATQPLAYEQKAPIGYLWAVRLLVVLFGKGEMALRLFSLLTGIASLLLFVLITRYFLKPWAALLALAMLATATPIVYHAVEAKQYATGLFASILAIFLFIRYHHQTDKASLLKWGLAGAALVWFSFSAIFVLAGIAFAVCLNMLLKKDWSKLFHYTIPFTLWLCSFAAIYFLFLNRYHDSDWLITFFEDYYNAFMPIPPKSGTDLKWFIDKAGSLLAHPLGQTLNFIEASFYISSLLRIVPLVTLIAGIVILLKKNCFQFTVLAFPILLVLVASGLKLYPFHERFVLFLAPIFILFLSYGFQVFSTCFPEKLKVKLLLTILLLAPLISDSLKGIFNTDFFYKNEVNREALLYINKRYKEGDAVFIYWNMWHAYLYYKEAYNLKYSATKGKDKKHNSQNQEEYLSNLSPDVERLKNHNRLWFLYHTQIRNNIGGYIGQPSWYFDRSFIPGKMLEYTISAFGKRMEEGFNHKETVVSQYNLAPLN